MKSGAGPAAAAQTSIGPLVILLRQELASAGVACPRSRPTTIESFTRWYLEVVQLLEAHIASGGEHPPISRTEVELMCRCAMSAATLQQAIELCARYSRMLYPRAGRPSLSVRGQRASFRLDSLRRETTTASSLVDITGLFAFRQLLQWLVGVDLQLRQVCIGPVERDDVLPFLQLFKAPVLAGGEVYALEFPSKLLDLPLVRTAGEFDAFFDVFPCGVFADTSHDLAQQVMTLLSAAARQGGGLPLQQEVADTLGVPLSTFRRRLSLAGMSFRQLREDSLRATALNLLGRERFPISDVAAHLGFSDAAAFRRAFIQWTGHTPSAWRAARL